MEEPPPCIRKVFQTMFREMRMGLGGSFFLACLRGLHVSMMVLLNLGTLGLWYWFSGGGPQAEMEIFTLCLFGNGQMCGRRHAAPWERDIYDGASDVRPTALLFSSRASRELKKTIKTEIPGNLLFSTKNYLLGHSRT